MNGLQYTWAKSKRKGGRPQLENDFCIGPTMTICLVCVELAFYLFFLFSYVHFLFLKRLTSPFFM